MVKFQPLVTADKTSTLIQQNINKALDPISTNPIVSGVYVSGVFNAAQTDVAFSHNLGNANVGYHMGKTNLPITIYSSPNTSPTPTQTLLLRANAPSGTTLSKSNPANVTVYFYVEG